MANDMTILGGIVALFIFIGIATPYFNAEFGDTGMSEYDVNTIHAGQDSGDATGVSAWKIIKSVLLMFLWTFGGLPLWLDLILFEPMRIVIYVLVARNLWPGGGG